MNLRDFINYFRKCPLCKSWITLDADIPPPSELEINKESLLLSVYEAPSISPKLFKLNLNSNQVDSSHPFVFRGLQNDLRRIFSGSLSDHLKIEARCYNCMCFRYWSNNMTLDSKTRQLKDVGVSGERIKLKKTPDEFLLSSMHNIQATEVSINGRVYQIPFLPFSSLNFKKPRRVIDKIKLILLLS